MLRTRRCGEPTSDPAAVHRVSQLGAALRQRPSVSRDFVQLQEQILEILLAHFGVGKIGGG